MQATRIWPRGQHRLAAVLLDRAAQVLTDLDEVDLRRARRGTGPSGVATACAGSRDNVRSGHVLTVFSRKAQYETGLFAVP